jgi:hypothetical protein
MYILNFILHHYHKKINFFRIISLLNILNINHVKLVLLLFINTCLIFFSIETIINDYYTYVHSSSKDKGVVHD